METHDRIKMQLNLVRDEGNIQPIFIPVILAAFTQSLYIRKPTQVERNSKNVKLLKTKTSQKS